MQAFLEAWTSIEQNHLSRPASRRRFLASELAAAGAFAAGFAAGFGHFSMQGD